MKIIREDGKIKIIREDGSVEVTTDKAIGLALEKGNKKTTDLLKTCDEFLKEDLEVIKKS